MGTESKLTIEAKRAIIRYAISRVGTRKFGILLKKQDGTYRTMSAQMHVKKHLRGTGPSTAVHLSEYITVYDENVKGYRNVNLDRVLSITVDGNQIHFYENRG